MTVAPGIRRFAGVEPKLAGGSAPTPSGLDWLADKGYKTIVDLREENNISAAFIADVARRGLRYIPLPISLKTVDTMHVDRFEFELTVAGGRPLYFCDTDGTRAGVMWYIHRVLVDKIDPMVARRDAEELGLTDDSFREAATRFIESRNTTETPAPKPAPVPSDPSKGSVGQTKPNRNPATEEPINADLPRLPVPASDSLVSPGAAAGVGRPSVDPTAWKSLAAMMVTGLGVPLAYLSRSTIPTSLRALARASLPGPRRAQRSLPPASGDGK
ncbi:MAG: hypothetical protein NVSMB9_05820 [Isosphaeraceae bacterium]